MTIMRGCATALGVVLFVSACGGGGGDGDAATPGNPGTPTPAGPIFAPAADDLATAINADYPNQTTALLVNATYQSTSIPGSGPYIHYSDGRCTDVVADPLAYPNDRTTLVTLNRTTLATKTDSQDACLPEIKISVASLVADFIAGNADMRVRGSSTRDTVQKSFRIRTKKDSGTGLRPAMWFGEDTLQLNKHPYDLTRVRNKLALDLMKQIPHHQTLRTQFVEINYSDSINTPPATGPLGSLGLFTHVEKFSESYMTRRGWKVAGANIYKAGAFDFNKHAAFGCNPDGTSNAALEAALELEAGDGKACTSIMKMLDDLDDENIPFTTTFNQYFNRNNYLTWLASVILLGNYDTTTQNFALYRSPDNGKFYFLPWDYDGALDYSHQMAAEAYANWAYGAGNWWDSALHRRFMAEPGNIALLQAAVNEIRDKYLTRTAIKTLLDSYKPTVRGFIQSAPDKDYLPGSATEAQWEAEFDRLVDVIDKNYNSFVKSLKDPMPFWFSLFTDPGNNITKLGWEWPTPFHPQGHQITYQVDFLPFLAGDTTLPRGQTAFDAPGGRTIISHSTGTSVELPGASLPSGAHWIRVLAKDATNGTSTYAFDSVYDTQTRHGVICKVLPANTNCAGVQ
ncbi:CotH kinase family protein [Imbroritus primus]|uniref:CotH kinase family protein n=1 Tax=Imbroritus primus TaxID=3058603 RepID=UPI003D161FB4